MGTTTLQELLALPGPERLELAMSLWQSLDAAEQITLKVRSRGASGGDFATFSLRVADAKVLAANERHAQLQLLGNDPTAWDRFLMQLKSDQAGLAAALLSSPQAPAVLRQSLQCNER